ncbi:MAG: hypothetical protein L0G99_03765 [Propionibacteriales bacterium]|nr:hypothetical protein [Propionibacteriales bacterium]
MSARDIEDFGRKWDPQYFHTDASAAEASFFGGLVASGLHTLSVFQRLAVQSLFVSWRVIAGKAIHSLRLLEPVRPDDTLSGRVTIRDLQPDGRGRSAVVLFGELDNQFGRTVMEVVVESLIVQAPPIETP